MSGSNETFDERFGEFFDQLSSMTDKEDITKSDIEPLVDAFFVAPEMISEYLAACSRLTELRATIEARVDHERQVPNAGQRGASRVELVHAYRELDALWSGVLKTCENIEQLPKKARKFLAKRV